MNFICVFVFFLSLNLISSKAINGTLTLNCRYNHEDSSMLDCRETAELNGEIFLE